MFRGGGVVHACIAFAINSLLVCYFIITLKVRNTLLSLGGKTSFDSPSH